MSLSIIVIIYIFTASKHVKTDLSQIWDNIL